MERRAIVAGGRIAHFHVGEVAPLLMGVQEDDVGAFGLALAQVVRTVIDLVPTEETAADLDEVAIVAIVGGAERRVKDELRLAGPLLVEAPDPSLFECSRLVDRLGVIAARGLRIHGPEVAGDPIDALAPGFRLDHLIDRAAKGRIRAVLPNDGHVAVLGQIGRTVERIPAAPTAQDEVGRAVGDVPQPVAAAVQREFAVVLNGVQLHAQSEMLEVVCTGHLSGHLLGALQRGHQNAHQQRNDGYYHEQLDERKRPGPPHRTPRHL